MVYKLGMRSKSIKLSHIKLENHSVQKKECSTCHNLLLVIIECKIMLTCNYKKKSNYKYSPFESTNFIFLLYFDRQKCTFAGICTGLL